MTLSSKLYAEPFGSQVIAKGHGEEFYLSKDLWHNHPCCVFVMRTEIIEKHPEAIFLSQDKEIIKKVLTDPPDRILTSELFPIMEDIDAIQKYMMDKMKIMTSLIDLTKFIDTSFAKKAGAK